MDAEKYIKQTTILKMKMTERATSALTALTLSSRSDVCFTQACLEEGATERSREVGSRTAKVQENITTTPITVLGGLPSQTQGSKYINHSNQTPI